MAHVQVANILESVTRPFEGKMGWLPWSSSSSHTPPTVLPEEPAKPQETASQNASSTVPSDRTPRPLPNPPNPLGPIEGAFIPEGSVPRLRRVFAGFMNEQATPFVRPLAASPWVQNRKTEACSDRLFYLVIARIGSNGSTAGRHTA